MARRHLEPLLAAEAEIKPRDRPGFEPSQRRL